MIKICSIALLALISSGCQRIDRDMESNESLNERPTDTEIATFALG
jgi:hypothetical protein